MQRLEVVALSMLQQYLALMQRILGVALGFKSSNV